MEENKEPIKVNRSIHNILSELVQLVDILEDNGGEITEETEALLFQNRLDFTNKVDSYCAIIREKESRVGLIKDEVKRLQDRAKATQNAADKLERILLEAVKTYGTVTKTGTKMFETTLNKLSTRKSNSTVFPDEIALKEAIIENVFDHAYDEAEELTQFQENARNYDLGIPYSIAENPDITDVDFEEVPPVSGGLFDSFDNENAAQPSEPQPDGEVSLNRTPLNEIENDFIQNHLTYNAKLSVKYSDLVKVVNYLVKGCGYHQSNVVLDVTLPKKDASEIIKNGKGLRIAKSVTDYSLTMK